MALGLRPSRRLASQGLLNPAATFPPPSFFTRRVFLGLRRVAGGGLADGDFASLAEPTPSSAGDFALSAELPPSLTGDFASLAQLSHSPAGESPLLLVTVM